MSDQRKHPRRDLELPVAVTDADRRVEGTISFDATDLSVGGAFLEADLLLEIGEVINVSFELPGGHAVQVRATVVRVVRDPGAATAPLAEVPGMGLEFTRLSDPDRAAIRACVSSKK